MMQSNKSLSSEASDQTTMASGEMSLKLLVDKEHNKVLFAEVGKDFVDFLINLLALPLASVVSLLKQPTVVGCISNLHSSLENLSESYMEAGQQMDTLLRPPVPVRNTNFGLLLHDIDAQLPSNKFYRCPTGCGWNITDDPSTNCTSCHRIMNLELPFVSKNRSSAGKDLAISGAGGYVKGLVTYMVTDDLSVSPMSMISAVTLMSKFKVKDFNMVQEKVVQFGMPQGLELLKASLLSNAALTEVFLTKNEPQKASAA